MESAWLIRPLTLSTVVVALSTDAVVQAQISPPLHQENFRALLSIKPHAPLPIFISLGPYSVEARAFTGCQAMIPDQRHTVPTRKAIRMAYRRSQMPPHEQP